MKSLKVFIILLIPILGASQNYQNICSPGITFFKSPDNYLKAFRLDSVYNVNPNDSVYLSYRAIRDTGYNYCRDTTNGSILGLKTYCSNTGFYYFFNRYQDSIKLNTNAGLNQSWKFMQLTSNSWLYATVTQVMLDSVLGNLDSIKDISFQAKNNVGQNISHIMNGRNIHLSKNYGLSQMYDVYWFPDDTTEYYLCGKTSLSLGINNISWQDVYNFDIGDEFHYSGSIHYYPGPAYTDYSRIKKILDKQVFTNPDSIAYQEEYCEHRITYTQYGPIIQNTNDTIAEGFGLSANPQLIRLPDEFVPANDLGIYANEYSRTLLSPWNTTTQVINEGDYYYQSCFGPPWEWGSSITYSVGLGVTSWWSWGTQWDTDNESLVYYKKGSIVWGTQVATDCNTLVPMDTKPQKKAITIEIIPNPVRTSAEVHIFGMNEDSGMMFSIFDGLGRQVLDIPVTNKDFNLDCSGFHPGLFFYRLTNQSGKSFSIGKVIVN